jgi:hypothetical protein
MKKSLISISIILCSSLIISQNAHSQTPNLDKVSIKNLDDKIKSLSTSIKYHCSENQVKGMCDQILKSTDKSILVLSRLGENNNEMKAKIDNLKKLRKQIAQIK